MSMSSCGGPSLPLPPASRCHQIRSAMTFLPPNSSAPASLAWWLMASATGFLVVYFPDCVPITVIDTSPGEENAPVEVAALAPAPTPVLGEPMDSI